MKEHMSYRRKILLSQPWRWGEGRELKPQPAPTKAGRLSLPDYAKYLHRMAKRDGEGSLWEPMAGELDAYLKLRGLP